MRKAFIFIAASLLLFTACGNQQGKKKQASDTKSTEEQYLTQDLRIKIDSLISEMDRLNWDPIFISVQGGKIVLSEQEKKVKPDYLLPLSRSGEFVTLSQKYRATMIYRMDMAVAELYGMPLTEYKQTIAKLIIDINNPAFKVNINEDARRNASSMQKFISNMYNEELDAGTLNFFWDAAIAGLIEDLYIATQHIDMFMACFTDKSASEVTYRFILAHQAIEELIPYHPELEDLKIILEPLKVINAIDKRQLRAQLLQLKDEIATARGNLLL